MTKSRGIQAPRQPWTDSDLRALQDRYPDERTEDLASFLDRPLSGVYRMAAKLGLKKSAEFQASPASGRTTGHQGGATRFAKGFTPWNKGTHFDSGGRSAETRFKPGTAPPNRLPVGYIRKNSDGYLDIKVAPGMLQWVPLHRWNWKQAHGEYPAPGMALIFKDGNRTNCDIGNLELVSRVDLMKKNTRHNWPKELSDLTQLRGAITRQINKRMKNEQ